MFLQGIKGEIGDQGLPGMKGEIGPPGSPGIPVSIIFMCSYLSSVAMR